MDTWRKLSLAFAAGGLGALVSTIFRWMLITTGFTAWLGITLHASASYRGFLHALYPQIVIDGLWALLLVTPFLKDSWWKRGLLLGSIVAIAAMFLFMPWKRALDIGLAVFLITLIVNWVVGLTAAAWYKLVV